MSEGSPRSLRSLKIGVGAALVVIVGVFAVTVAMGVARSAGENIEAVPFADAAGATAAPVYVHVSGAVNSPGVYVVDSGARIVDAIAAAGGFREDAATDTINLAREVVDGEQIIVAVIGEQIVPIDDGLININSATAAELEELPRIGEALAGRIITFREENGPFRSIEDLGNVSGIGEKMLEALRPLVKVG